MDHEHTTTTMSSTGRRPCTAIKDKGHNERLSLSWSQSLDVHNNANAAATARSRAASLGGSSQEMEAPVRNIVLLYIHTALSIDNALLLLVGLTLFIKL
jgi:hypothetical protein